MVYCMDSFDFMSIFKKKLNERNINWYVKALVDSDNNLLTLGTDSKLIGRIFELKSMVLLQEIAKEHKGYELVKPEAQTIYPDYLYMCPDGSKIAVDIKTTYLDTAKGKNTISYTLGAYTSYLRNGTKNIEGSYDEYTHHYIVGFVYDRLSNEDGIILPNTQENLASIPSPYGNVRVWVQEKYKIAGTSEGSGNTANIGSISSKDLSDFENGNGPFSVLGEDIFEDYWRNFKYHSTTYKSIEDYISWAKESSPIREKKDYSLILDQYIQWRRIHSPTKEDYLLMAIKALRTKGKRGADKELSADLGKAGTISITKKKNEILEYVVFCENNAIPIEIIQL